MTSISFKLVLQPYSRSAQFQLCQKLIQHMWDRHRKCMCSNFHEPQNSEVAMSWHGTADWAEISVTGVSRSAMYFGTWLTIGLWVNIQSLYFILVLTGSHCSSQTAGVTWSPSRILSKILASTKCWQLSAVPPMSSLVDWRGWHYSSQVVKHKRSNQPGCGTWAEFWTYKA